VTFLKNAVNLLVACLNILNKISKNVFLRALVYANAALEKVME